MKMTQPHFHQLNNLIIETVNGHAQRTNSESRAAWLEQYRATIVEEGKAKDVDTRVAWDLMWAVDFNKRSPLFDELYEYLNDDHITTALKQIYKDLMK